MHINRAGLDLIKRFEGVKLEAYKDTHGLWAIGVGHTNGVKQGDVIDDAMVDKFLAADVAEAEEAVSDAVVADLNINQFSALVCLTFNIGKGALRNSTLCRKVNNGDFEAAANEFQRWNHAEGNVLPGLTRRRQAEEELFRRPALKPLVQSRTLAGTGVAGAATAVSVADQLSGATSTISTLAPYYRWAAILLGVLAIAGVGYAAWARYDDHRNAVR